MSLPSRSEAGPRMLPLPVGDPGSLYQAAALMRGLGAHATDGVLATHGERAFFLDRIWSGVAGDAARRDAALTAERIGQLGQRLVRAAAALSGYADALDLAQRTVRALQLEWDGATARGSEPPLVLGGERTACLNALEEAGDHAAAVLGSLLDQALTPPRAGEGRALGPGTVADATIRDAVLAGLAVVTGRLSVRRAEADVAHLMGVFERIGQGSPGAIDDAAALLATRAEDPVFAQAVMARLSPQALADLLAICADRGPQTWAVDPGWLDSRTAALVAGLGVAMTTAANPERARGLDPATSSRLDRWRPTWLAGMAASVAAVRHRADGTAVGGGWVQGQLLAGAASRGPGHSPGVGYVTSVGVALIAAERAGLRAETIRPAPGMHFTGTHGQHHSVAGPGREDAVLALEQALRGDVLATRAFLLAPLPGERDVLVLDHLVADRYRLLPDPPASTSMDVLGQLLVEAGSDQRDAESTHLTSRFLNDVGAAATDCADLGGFRRAVAPALGPIATLVAAHPDALTDVLEGTTHQGNDVAQLGSGERLVRTGRDPGTYELVWTDRHTASRVFGELAMDRVDRADSPTGPTRSPALSRAVSTIAEHQQEALVAALGRADHDPRLVDTEAARLGRTVGFAIASGGEALAGAQASLDQRHGAVLSVAESVIDDTPLPGGPAVKAVTALVRQAAGSAVAQLLPTGAEAGQRLATEVTLTRAGDDAVVAGRTLVSQAAAWTPEQAPQRWAAATGRTVTPFWDDAGRPRPETSMRTAELRSFNDWRRDVSLSVYDDVPQRIRAAVDLGAADVPERARPRR